MERFAGALEEAADGTRQQERHYQLLSALQNLVKELPSSFQQRLSYTTLSDLALALLDGTVFEIVQGLLEIQHLTEKSLYNQRLRLQNEHRGGGAPDPRGAAGDGPEDRAGAGPQGGRPAEHTGEGWRGRLLRDHQPAGADAADEPVGTHPEAAAEGLPGGEGGPVTRRAPCWLPAAQLLP
ncbi:protein DGCR6L isoform X2 [Oryctolagus cuniculus]|uniref:protein DGCR6L isoform X2 n=1 Tax=Oryctolagus cuniculus TaxID=9986 RepID=UPI00387902B3